MAYETSPDRLRMDLQDDLFTCYVHVGAESDKGWENAVFATSFLTRINIYLFEDHTHLKEWIGSKRPAAIAFGWKADVEQTLTKAETEDLMTVMNAMTNAQG